MTHDTDDRLPRLYTELADWYQLLASPADYAEEAAFYTSTILAANPRTRSLLELGCGGGNNASFMKSDFAMTLTDRAGEMLAVSRTINPECEHLEGDMRSLRLQRHFDAVFVHDAIMYMTSPADLEQAIATAYAHARPDGGVVVLAPDCVTETFRERTCNGGHDDDRRSLRYLEWMWDPDPDDTVFCADFAYLLRDAGQPPKVVHEQHTFGLFPRAFWLEALRSAGLQQVDCHSGPGDDSDDSRAEVFVARRQPD